MSDLAAVGVKAYSNGCSVRVFRCNAQATSKAQCADAMLKMHHTCSIALDIEGWHCTSI